MPFSLNTHYFADYKDKFLAHYKGTREKYERGALIDVIDKCNKKPRKSSKTDWHDSEPTGIDKVLAGLAEMGMSGVKPEDLPKLLPPDRMEPALLIMADVRAYFQGTFICPLFIKEPTDAIFSRLQAVLR